MEHLILNRYISRYITCYRKINPIWALLQRYPTKNTDWHRISKNIHITWEIVQQNLTSKNPFPWDWHGLSQNINLTADIIEQNINMPWSWYWLSLNPSITWELVQQNLDKKWCWYYLSRNPAITCEIIEQNSNYDWDYYSMSFNPNLTWEFLNRNLNKNWHWYWVSAKVNVTCEIIEQNLNSNNPLPWNWVGLSQNPNITLDFVINNLDKTWNWYYVSKNLTITWTFIEQNLVNDNPLPLSWKGLSLNPNIMNEKNIEKICIEYGDKNWDWTSIYLNSAEIHNIYNNTEKKNKVHENVFRWYNPSLNPNITLDYISKHNNSIGIDCLMNNKFLLYK